MSGWLNAIGGNGGGVNANCASSICIYLFKNCTFERNFALAGRMQGGLGGAANIDQGNFTDCVFSRNVAERHRSYPSSRAYGGAV